MRRSGLITVPAVGAGAPDAVGSRLMTPLVILAATELLLLRTFTRTAIHIPGIERSAGPYRVVSETGRLAYYLAVVVLVLFLIERIASEFKRADPRPRVAIALTIFLAAAVAARAGLVGDAWLALAIAVALGLALPVVRVRLPGRRAWPLLTLGSALLVSVVHSLLQPARAGPWDVSWLLLGAEGLAVAGAIIAPLAVPGGREAVALRFAVPVAALSSAALLAAGPTVRILLLWNVGVAGYFPSLAYAVAAGAVVYAIVAARARDRRISHGLALLVLGGFALQSTYQTGLFLAGLATLGQDPDPAARVRGVRRSYGTSPLASTAARRG